ncbi:tryptophan synthase beta subunit-like PLP-dependent enzyme [Umbelopsis sp. PMI_123]|nr:tryptophan synthase beta subunit-like PLP-dependent enzyme [Umbelopsis sp. PMI_123]
MPLEHQPPKITSNLAENVGLTPMVRIMNDHSNNVELLAKLEYTNFTGSIKERTAKFVIQDLKARNKLTSKTTIIIPTSGNLAISVAGLVSKDGNKVIAVVPERTSIDKIHLLKALGVEIIRAPTEARREAAENMYSTAYKLSEQLQNSVVIDETNLPSATYDDLAEEILQQTALELDFVFVGVETGSTITRLAKALKAEKPEVKIYGVEPIDSVFADREKTHHHRRKEWKIEDLGSNFVPQNFDGSLIDGWIQVSDKDAYSTARRLLREEGPSSGAVVWAALDYASKVQQHTTHNYRSVAILNDTMRNYMSTLLSDEWLLENDLVDEITTKQLEYLSSERYRAASVEDLQLPAAVTISPSATVSHALNLMLEREYSQLPVIHSSNKKLVGYVSQSTLEAHLSDGSAQPNDSVSKWMFNFLKRGKGQKSNAKYEMITPDTSLADLAKFFEKNSFAVVTDADRKWCLGVATKYDLISFLNRRNVF